MSAIGRARVWIRSIVARGRLEREMKVEMAAHIALATERFVARGMSTADALHAAHREFGQLGPLQEAARDARGGLWLDATLGDLKYAFRHYRRTPLVTITIVLTLALGIGFSSAVFSVVTGIVMRPAPGVPDNPALMKIRGMSSVAPVARELSYPELAGYAALHQTFAAVAGWFPADLTVNVGAPQHGTLKALGQFVTPNYFNTLGVRLAAGRDFDQSRLSDLNPVEIVGIVSTQFAMELSGDVRQAVGKQVKINDVAVTIIGVAPPDFNGALRSDARRMLWLPLSAWPAIAHFTGDPLSDPNALLFQGIGRLQPGVTLADALPAVRLASSNADRDAKTRLPRAGTRRADLVRLRGIIDESGQRPELGPMVTISSLTALLILLLCTTTVSSLLLASAIARRNEIGVRLALGASRQRIVRQFLTEILVLAIAGGVVGIWLFSTIVRNAQVAAKTGYDVSPDARTLAFTVLLAVFAAVLCGLSPALHATRSSLSDVLKDGGASVTKRSRLQRAFVVAQITLALPVMVALALMIANFIGDVTSAAKGALRQRLIVANFDTSGELSKNAPDRMPALIQRIASLPGVTGVVPMREDRRRMTFQVGGSDTQTPASVSASAFVHEVAPGYLSAIDAPVAHGRDFVPGDTLKGSAAVVITERLAAELFGAVDPLGKRVTVRAGDDSSVVLEVAGVVKARSDITSQGSDDLPSAYVPFRPNGEGTLLIRTKAPADGLIPTIVSVARQDARDVPLNRIVTLAERDRERQGFRAKLMAGLASAAMIAILLAAIGLYALVGIAVRQRRREIGVRVALGARSQQVVRIFFMSGLRVSLVGLVLGLPFSLAAIRFFPAQNEIPRLHLIVAPVFVVAAVILVTSLASWLPARQAATVDPMEALRSE